MRLHSNVITPQQIIDALKAEQEAGRIAPSVYLMTRTQHKSQTHARAFEVRLAASDDGTPGRRPPGFGGEGMAATYDEWGWLMSALYGIDSAAVWGSAKRPTYADQDDFDHKTGMTYNFAEMVRLLSIRPMYETRTGVSNDPYPYTHANKAGRRGAGRVSEDDYYRGFHKYLPRTLDSYRAFAHVAGANTKVDV